MVSLGDNYTVRSKCQVLNKLRNFNRKLEAIKVHSNYGPHSSHLVGQKWLTDQINPKFNF